MKRYILGLAAAAALTGTWALGMTTGMEVAQTSNGVRMEGAARGEWTHDWDAALAAAKADGGMVFANFTGSDWCGWCRLMAERVFSTETWSDWAGGQALYLAWVDFPEDVSLLPGEETQRRNQLLAQKYQVQGFPSFLLLDGDGAVKGRFGASRTATAEAFVAEVQSAMVAAGAAGDAWRAEEIGATFPRELGGLPYRGRQDYGSRAMGYSLRYGEGATRVDVYVYDGGVEEIGEGATADARDQVAETMKATAAWSQTGEVKDLRLPTASRVVKAGGVKYVVAGMQYDDQRRGAPGSVDSTVAVTGRRGKFVKVRYSRPRTGGEAFLDAGGLTEDLQAVLLDLGRVLAGAE